jgi:hypothetical protein
MSELSYEIPPHSQGEVSGGPNVVIDFDAASGELEVPPGSGAAEAGGRAG